MNALMMRARWLFDPQRDLHTLALGGAWMFALGSLVPLLWLLGAGGDGYVFHTVVGGKTVSIPLLAYSGWPGWLLLWAETLAISGATILTAAPRFVPLKWQRIGHGVLIGWSGIWALGAWRLGLVDFGFWTFQALFLSGLCACTVYRAARHWTPRASLPPSLQQAQSPPATEIETKIGEGRSYFDEHAAATPSAASRRAQIMNVLHRIRHGAVSGWRRGVAAFRSGMNNRRGDARA